MESVSSGIGEFWRARRGRTKARRTKSSTRNRSVFEAATNAQIRCHPRTSAPSASICSRRQWRSLARLRLRQEARIHKTQSDGICPLATPIRAGQAARHCCECRPRIGIQPSGIHGYSRIGHPKGVCQTREYDCRDPPLACEVAHSLAKQYS